MVRVHGLSGSNTVNSLGAKRTLGDLQHCQAFIPERCNLLANLLDNVRFAQLDNDFFLTTCLDQVEFLGKLLDPQAILFRLELWTEERQRLGNLAPGSWPLLREAVLAGEFGRGKAPALTGYQDRQARTPAT